MKNHVVSLELAKRLKEAGYPQEGEFYWFPHREMDTHKLVEWKLLQHNGSSEESCAAPIATELLDSFPKQLKLGNTWYSLRIKRHNHTKALAAAQRESKHQWKVGWIGKREKSNKPYPILWQTHGKRLQNALAEMWLWLKKEVHV